LPARGFFANGRKSPCRQFVFLQANTPQTAGWRAENAVRSSGKRIPKLKKRDFLKNMRES
jgi:hypothetical protein